MEDPIITLLGTQLLIIFVMLFFKKTTNNSYWDKWLGIITILFIVIDLIAIPKLL